MTGQEQATPVVPAHRAAYDAALTEWRGTCNHPDDGTNTPPVQQGCPGCAAYSAACEAFIAAVTRQNAKDAEEGYRYTALVAECTVCGQEFCPTSENDMIHLMTTVPPGVKWGDPSTYTAAGVKLGALSGSGIAALAAALAGADSTDDARRALGGFASGPPEGPDRYCGGRGEMLGGYQ
jgi:hypothetical protein